MSSVGYSSSKRATAYAAAQAAKARRQKIIVGALCLVLVAVLAYEAPSFLKLVRGNSNSPPSSTSVPPAVVPQTPATQKALATLRKAKAVDPFQGAVSVSSSDAVIGDVAIPPASHDPFAPLASSGSSAAAAAASVPLPSQIVIGTPGGNRQATRGWIVILASIPTSEGETTATRFAASARQNGVQQVAVLNSSNRRPLRGGYWVVYTGPYKSVGDVSAIAATVHSHGYATAYIRELIVYR